jgi:cell envelope-related function transcriptional attenuator common domain
MPFDSKDIFGYDNLYVTDKKKDGDGDYLPLGSGRKSEFALGSKAQASDAPTDESQPAPKPKKKAHPTAKSGGAKKKTSSSAAKKKKTSSGEAKTVSKKPSTVKPKKTASLSKTDEKTVSPEKETKPKKKPAAKKKTAKKQTKRKRSAKEEFFSFAYLGAMAVGGVVKKVFGTRRKRLIAASLLGMVLIIWGVMSVRSMYTSKTMFSDDGKELDETAIQERLITDEQNKDKVTYFLIIGVDKSQKLTDCIWLMCFDNAAHKMNVMQIPRDTYVGSDSVGRGKINAVYKTPKTVNWCEKCGKEVADEEIQSDTHTVCGTGITERTESNINAVIRVINKRLSLPVDHYVLFDFEGFEKVIDAMGGVDIYLEEEMKVYPNKKTFITLPAGLNHLDGATALKYMRTRKNYANGDLGRVKGQRRLIKSLFEKVDKMSSVEALKILSAAYGNFKTDMSLEEIRSFIAPVKKCGSDSLHMFELPGHDRWVKPHPSYYICDEEQAVEEINQYLLPYSDKLTVEDLDFPDLGY